LKAKLSQGKLPFEIGQDAIKPSAPYAFSKLSRAKPTEVYTTYWKFAAERQRVFHRRAAGKPQPWTDDSILRTYRFTNAYRAADRVSQFLIQSVIYDGSPETAEVVFRILLFKFFNRISTWQKLVKAFGSVTWEGFDFERYAAALTSMMDRGERVFSSAYIMPSYAPGFRESRKHCNFLRLLDMMMKDSLPKRLSSTKEFSEVFALLRAYPLLGDFLAFQFSIDLNYSEIISYDEMDFVVAGPGAKSGLRKCFSSPGDLSETDLIRMVTESQQEEFERVGEDFQGLWGRPLMLIDCQNLFCEVDKYARVAHPLVEGIGSRTRIKQSYIANSESVQYWFPPKWGLDTQVRVKGE